MLVFNELAERASEYLQRRNSLYAKEERRFSQIEACVFLGNLNRKTLNSYIEKAGIDVKSQAANGTKWSISLSELYAVRELLPPHLKQNHGIEFANKQCQVLLLFNQKGGVGKTTCSLTVASGLALRPEAPRIAVIDLDGQATASMYYAPKADDEYFSVGDLIRGNYELDADEDEAEFFNSCFLETTIPNLKILPAAQRDRGLDGWFHNAVANGLGLEAYKRLETIVAQSKDNFDIIIIDSAPSLNFATYNGLMAATSIVIPIGASENDIDATCHFLTTMPDVAQFLENAGHSGYDFVRMLVTNFTDGATEIALKTTLTRYFGATPYGTPMKYSEPVQYCSAIMSTLFDLSASEYPKTKSSFNNAIDNALAVVGQIYDDILLAWAKQNG